MQVLNVESSYEVAFVHIDSHSAERAVEAGNISFGRDFACGSCALYESSRSSFHHEGLRILGCCACNTHLEVKVDTAATQKGCLERYFLYVLTEVFFALYGELGGAQWHTVESDFGECIVGKSHIHAVGHSLVERDFAIGVVVVRFVNKFYGTSRLFAGGVDSHSGYGAFAKHLVAKVDYVAHLVALVHFHIARIVVVVYPSALRERECGKSEIVVAKDEVEDVGIVRNIYFGEQVIAKIDILQLFVVAKVDFG